MFKLDKNLVISLIYSSLSLIVSIFQAMSPAICIQIVGVDCPYYLFEWSIFSRFIFYFGALFIVFQAIYIYSRKK